MAGMREGGDTRQYTLEDDYVLLKGQAVVVTRKSTTQ